MDNELINSILEKSVDDLYIELNLNIEYDSERSFQSKRDELISSGRKKFDEVIEDVQSVVCNSNLYHKINSGISENELFIVIADALTDNLTKLNMPIFTITGLVIKIGVSRICRNYKK